MNDLILNWIDDFNKLVSKLLPTIMAEFEEQRFMLQGQISNHDRWVDNTPYTLEKKKDRSTKPNIDYGDLLEIVKDTSNWQNFIRETKSDTTATFEMANDIDFTPKKYDLTNNGGGNNVPARNFKSITDADIEYILNTLVAKIMEQYA